MSVVIQEIRAVDRRFQLKEGAGSDAVHTNPAYAYAVCELHAGDGLTGTGITLHMGQGNELNCGPSSTWRLASPAGRSRN